MSPKRTLPRNLKTLPLALAVLLLPAAVPAARADCPDEPLICRAPLYEPLEYLGCAIAGNLSPGGMCWSWFPFGCFPCDGDAGQCNALNPTECINGSCQALTSLEYYDACDGGGGPPELARTAPIPPAAPAPDTVPTERWVGTITPEGGRPRSVTVFAWMHDQPHLRIETEGGEVWARDVALRGDTVSFGFFDNDEARCELTRDDGGTFVGTCVEPEAGTAHLRVRRARR